MTFTFVCQSCDDTFEAEYSELTEETRGLRCPNCGKRLSAADADEFATALDELLGIVAGLRKRFLVSFEVDAEDLPEAYEEDIRPSRSRDDDDDDEVEEEDDDDLLLEDDEDLDEEESY